MNGFGELLGRSDPVLPGEGLDLVVRARFRLDFVDLTDVIQQRVEAACLVDGACVVFCRHTTCALIVNEWEDGAQEDFRRRLEAMFPVDDYYIHDDLDLRTQNLVPGERRNGQAHVMQMLMGGTSVTLPVRDGALLLGRWQRVAMIELDRPKDRMIALQMLSSTRSPGPGDNPRPVLRHSS